MEQDIHKLADWLVKVSREGVMTEQKILAWKAAEKNLQRDTVPPSPRAKES